MATRGRVLAVAACVITAGLGMVLPGAAPAGAGQVAFRSDHTVVADGTPFFPIGIYGADLGQGATVFDEIADYGFNTVGIYGWDPSEHPDGPTRQWMDAAHARGIKTWVRGYNGFQIPDGASGIEQSIRLQVQRLRDHPGLLWWEVADEPGLNAVPPDELSRGQAVLRSEDAHHPLAIMEAAKAEFMTPYTSIGDLAGTWRYPGGWFGFLNHDLSHRMRLLQEVRGDRPRYFALQGWSVDPVVADWQSTYPTPTQSRFMAYQAVILGAKALLYFGIISTSTPVPSFSLPPAGKDTAQDFADARDRNAWFWQQTRPLIRELRDATSIFVLPDAGPDLRVTASEAPTIQSVTKDGGGGLSVLAVNGSDGAVSPLFQLPEGVRPPSVTVEFEGGRTLPVAADGTFQDTFAGLDTHVYTVPKVAGEPTSTTTTSAAAPVVEATPLVTSVTPSRLRHDFAGWVGMRLRVGSTDLRVTSLGRWVSAGNAGTHAVKLVEEATGTVVASAAIHTAGKPAGAFAYSPLANAVTLRAGTSYLLLSEEAAGGDTWYDYDSAVTTTGAAHATGAVWAVPGGRYNVGGNGGQTFGPSSLLYDPGGSPPTTTGPTTTGPTTTSPTTTSPTTTGGPPEPGGASLVTSVTPTRLRHDFGGWVGMRVLVGSQDLRVSSLGRWVAAGNTRRHVIKLVDPATGAEVAATTVDTAGTASGQFSYAALASPIVLRANGAYLLLSEEVAGGDTWYDYDTRVTTSTDAAATGAVWASPGGAYNVGGPGGQAFGPASFLYGADGSSPPASTASTTSSTATVSTSTTSTTVAPAGGTPFVSSVVPSRLRQDFGGWVGMQVRVGSGDLRVTSLGRWVSPGNSGRHVLKVVDPATGDTVASATLDTAGAPPGAFAYAGLPSPVTLAAGATYYLLSQEAAGGDAWYDYDTQVTSTAGAAATGAVWAYPTGTYNPGGGAGQAFGPLSFLYG